MKIFYGICGEGLGHSGRSLALIERLTALGHAVTIFTFADAIRCSPRAATTSPHRGTPLARQRPRRRVDAGNAVQFRSFPAARPQSLDAIRQLALVERPDLFITDFEPLTALAAASLGIPCVSIDNQHRFCQPLGRTFHFRYMYGRMAGEFVRRWIKPRASASWPCFTSARPVGIFAASTPSSAIELPGSNPATATTCSSTAAAGSACGWSRSQHRPGALHRLWLQVPPPPTSSTSGPATKFAADLASSRAVVATAGHQLISEARYFGKPLLVVPMPNQHEQAINAHTPGWKAWRLRPDRPTQRRTHSTNATAPEPPPRPANGVDQTLELLGIGNG